MSEIPGERKVESRRNFHGSKGEHLFPHPSTYARRSEWTGWDKAYAAHLDRHRELADNPEPMDGDHPAAVALFEHIEVLKKIIENEKRLIVAIRRKAAQGREVDEAELEETRRVLRQGGVDV